MKRRTVSAKRKSRKSRKSAVQGNVSVTIPIYSTGGSLDHVHKVREEVHAQAVANRRRLYESRRADTDGWADDDWD